MRITVVTPLFPTSSEPYRGAPIYRTIAELAHLAEVEVICPLLRYPAWLGFRPRSFRYKDIDAQYRHSAVPAQYVEYPALPVITRPFNGLNCARTIVPYIRKTRPDVILGYWVYPEGLGALRAARQLGVPCVLGARGSDLNGNRDMWVDGRVREILRQADYLITVSEALRQAGLRRGARADRTLTIANGCDVSIFHPKPRADARAELAIRPETELVFFNGWISKLKGIWELLGAVRQLAEQRQHLQVACVGEGDLMQEWKAAIETAGLTDRFILLGRRKSAEISTWLAAANVFCLPSHSEGCPNAVVEALACGRAVVASSVGGIPEMVDANSGILCPPQDAGALATALDVALQRAWDEERIGAEHRRSWEDVARETFEVCRTVLADAGRIDADTQTTAAL